MTAEGQAHSPLHRLFSGLIEHVFNVDIGICDPALTDYLGDMLVDFVHVDRIYRLSTVNQEVIRDVSRMEAEAHLGPGQDDARRRRVVNRYIGDFTLFWTGVYPENLRPRQRDNADLLEAYLRQGKRSYGIAGELSSEGDAPSGRLLVQLSEQFEFCVHGLHLVREGWERIARREGRN